MAPPFLTRHRVQRLREGLWAEAEHEKCADTHAGNVLTDCVDETWNSGRKASPDHPVSLSIDLGSTSGAPTFVDHVHLMPYQVPTPACTTHRVLMDGELVAEVSGPTRHHHALAPVHVGRAGRVLTVQTVESPGWVAWSQVHVYGSHAGGAAEK